MNNRLNNLVIVLEKNVDKLKIEGFYKILLKSLMISVLFSNDNYLQTHNNVELYRFRNFSAYLKLLYAIRKNKTRKFILNAYFHKLAELISDFVPYKTFTLKKCVLNRLTRNMEYPVVFLKMTLLLWKQIPVLTRPNPVIFYIKF